MATAEQITQVRELVNEPTQTPYTDIVIGQRVDSAGGNLQIVAAAIWREKAGRYSELVDVQEGSSRRSLGDLYANALRMASYYDDAVANDGSTTGLRASRTRAIERP